MLYILFSFKDARSLDHVFCCHFQTRFPEIRLSRISNPTSFSGPTGFVFMHFYIVLIYTMVCLCCQQSTLATVKQRLFTTVSESWEKLSREWLPGSFSVLSLRPFGNTTKTQCTEYSLKSAADAKNASSKGNLFFVKQVWECHYNII